MSPRNVRNFWIEGRTDSGTTFATGPRSADGGFTATIYQRHNGAVALACRIEGRVSASGRLMLIIEPEQPGGQNEPEVFVDGKAQVEVPCIQVRSDR